MMYIKYIYTHLLCVFRLHTCAVKNTIQMSIIVLCMYTLVYVLYIYTVYMKYKYVVYIWTLYIYIYTDHIYHI